MTGLAFSLKLVGSVPVLCVCLSMMTRVVMCLNTKKFLPAN